MRADVFQESTSPFNSVTKLPVISEPLLRDDAIDLTQTTLPEKAEEAKLTMATTSVSNSSFGVLLLIE